MAGIVDHVVVEPSHSEIIDAVLEAIRSHQPLVLILETVGVDSPWAQRREIRARLMRLTMFDDGWLSVGGQPLDKDASEWFSMHLRIWHADGPPQRWVSWEEQLEGTPKAPDPAGTVLPVTATLVIS